jgi:predicted phage tail protein
MKVVKVYGQLREFLGQGRFEFVADTPQQALKALFANFPGLQKWMLDQEKDGMAYRVTVGQDVVHNDDVTGLFLPWSEREVFRIAPVLAGAGRGTGQILLGVGLIAASFLLPGAGLFGTTSIFGAQAAIGVSTTAVLNAAAFGTALSAVGASLVLSGVATMISPTPQPAPITGGRGKEAAKLESFSFSGVVNTTKQGLPVPIAYGRLFVGSAVLSSGLDTDD